MSNNTNTTTPPPTTSKPTSTTTASSAARTHTIKVGPKEAPHEYIPHEVDANVGDLIVFEFHPRNHSVVQADWRAPCVPADGDYFFSGIKNDFNEVNGQVSGALPTWNWTVPRPEVFCHTPPSSLHSRIKLLYGAGLTPFVSVLADILLLYCHRFMQNKWHGWRHQPGTSSLILAYSPTTKSQLTQRRPHRRVIRPREEPPSIPLTCSSRANPCQQKATPAQPPHITRPKPHQTNTPHLYTNSAAAQ